MLSKYISPSPSNLNWNQDQPDRSWIKAWTFDIGAREDGEDSWIIVEDPKSTPWEYSSARTIINKNHRRDKAKLKLILSLHQHKWQELQKNPLRPIRIKKAMLTNLI